MKRSPLVLLVAFIYLAWVQVVLANAYSARTYEISVQVPGYSGWTDTCMLAGIETGASNTGVVTSYFSNTPRCSTSDARPLASGYLGVGVTGYKDGSYCGTVGPIYSTSNTHYWQLWSTVCSNPSGLQEFHTWAYGKVWIGSGYQSVPGILSPSQNY